MIPKTATFQAVIHRLIRIAFFFLLGAFMVWFSANGGTDFLDPLLREWGVIFR